MAEDGLGIVGTILEERYRIDAALRPGGPLVTPYRALDEHRGRTVQVRCVVALSTCGPSAQRLLLDELRREAARVTELARASNVFVPVRHAGMLLTGDGEELPFLVQDPTELASVASQFDRHDAEPSAGGRRAAIAARGSREVRVRLERLLELLAPAAAALEVAHQRGCAHFGLGPETVRMVSAEPASRPRLVDFGVAQAVRAVARRVELRSLPMGLWPAPEVAPELVCPSLGTPGPASDVYSLAFLLASLVSGGPLLRADDPFELTAKIAMPSRPSLAHGIRGPLGVDVEAVLTKALATSPSDRFASAGEFWRSLRRATGVREAPRGRGAEKPSARQERKGPGGRVFASVVVGVGLGALLAAGLPRARPQVAKSWRFLVEQPQAPSRGHSTP